jgi:ceramide glucosyltransferase
MKEVYWQLLKAVWVFSIAVCALSTWLVYRHYGRRAKRKLLAESELPGVTIMKPLRGLEDGIFESIESFFKLDYPKYEILMSVADASDPTVSVARALIAKYPGISATLIIGDVKVGANPKINNMLRSYQRAQYETILISDSNARVLPNYLRNMVSNLDENVGVVSNAIFAENPKGVGGLFEAIYMNTFFAKMCTLLSRIGMPCVIGKSMLFTKSSMEKIGGLQALGNYIAEDYSCGRMMLEKGMKVAIAHEPIPQYVGTYSFETFWNRHTRWGRIRKLQNPAGFIVELIIGSICSAVIGAAVFKHFYHVPVQLFLAVHFSFWLICDSITMSLLGQKLSPKFLTCWLFREISHIPLWITIAASNTIIWRGQKLVLNLGGTIRADGDPALQQSRSFEPFASPFTGE